MNLPLACVEEVLAARVGLMLVLLTRLLIILDAYVLFRLGGIINSCLGSFQNSHVQSKFGPFTFYLALAGALWHTFKDVVTCFCLRCLPGFQLFGIWGDESKKMG